ncbi:unnamed protein product [Ambrosiozyma monospora]|uniref:Unnamed protein product n=1 Tax=Ambrosiozyma monospora TaxID=43982 RepID=A0A9W6Z2I7_AMBMO|nr:unnamed protein product [Ambrosiozyma monospora]
MSTPPINISNKTQLSKSRPRNIASSHLNNARSINRNNDFDNIFETGHFSAKYVIQQSTSSRHPASPIYEQVDGNLDTSKPLKISGGFESFGNLDDDEQEEEENRRRQQLQQQQLLQPAENLVPDYPQNRQPGDRRQSILSNLISSSQVGPSRLSGYVPSYRRSGLENDSMHSNPALQRLTTTEMDNPEPEVVDVVQRHLVSPSDFSTNLQRGKTGTSPAGGDFGSLKLQGGDITRGIYNWVNEQKQTDSIGGSSLRRVNSIGSSIHSRSENDNGDENDDLMRVNEIMRPGGFRRSYIAKKHQDKQLDEIRNQLDSSVTDSNLFFHQQLL